LVNYENKIDKSGLEKKKGERKEDEREHEGNVE
jgi:hypothetical protein